jgi:hypothetical protein
MIDFISNNSAAIAILISIFPSVLLGYIGYRANRRRHIREYTLSVLAPLLTDERLFSAHNIIIDHVISNTQIDYDGMSKHERELVLQILGYYEFLAAAFLRGDLDRATVLKQRRSSFKGAYTVSQSFIERRRQLLGRKTVYDQLERFVRRHCK